MLNIQRILFPTDFSDGARQAFPQAVFLADWHDATLHVLNVIEDASSDPEEGSPSLPASLDALAEWLGTSAEDGSMPDLKTLSLTQDQVGAGSAPERIVAYAEDMDVDLITMGTHGRRGLRRMVVGSVTEEVVRKGPCPVLTVRTSAEASPKEAIRRVLAPVDFSEASKAAVRHAKEIALTYGAEIDLLHVVQNVAYPSAYGFEPATFSMDEVLDRTEEQLGEMARTEIGVEHVVVEATVGDPAAGILDYVTANEVDLIVTATHGRTGFDRFLIGSVAERVLRQSPTPVFVVAPGRKSLLPTEAAAEQA
jgi:nucleotide-binding universal stress UspA family protein